MGAAADGAEIVRLAKEHAELKPVAEAVEALRARPRRGAPSSRPWPLGDDAEMAALAREELAAPERAPAGARARRGAAPGARGQGRERLGDPGGARRHRRRRGGAVRRRPLPHVPALRPDCTAGRSRSTASREGEVGGYKEIIASITGDGRVRAAEVRERRPPGAAGAGHRGARAASTPRPPPSRCCPRPRTSTSRSTTPTSASTPTARPAPAASTSTRPTRRCASPTCRPASSSPRRRSRSTRTARGR